jgi:hypothetical protein
MEPRKSLFFIIVNMIRFGKGPRTALSTDSDCDPLENVKDLSSTLVMLYLATPSLLRTALQASGIVGFGLTRLTHN